MNWPFLTVDTINREIDSITLRKGEVFQSNNVESETNETFETKVKHVIDHITLLQEVINVVPSLESLLLLRRRNLCLSLLQTAYGNESERVEMQQMVSSIEEQLEKRMFSLTSFQTTPEEEEAFSLAQKQMRKCSGDKNSYSTILHSMKQIPTGYSTVIQSDKLSDIPLPSDAQIEKDLRREIILLNGEEMEGSKGIASIQNQINTLLQSMYSVASEPLSNSCDPINLQILQQLCRTRIGEYCFDVLSSLFPFREGSLVLIADSTKSVPIEVQLKPRVFKVNEEWKWGACLHSCFVFNYTIEDIDEIVGQRVVVAHVTLRCQCCCCIGMAEFADASIQDIGLISVSIL